MKCFPDQTYMQFKTIKITDSDSDTEKFIGKNYL